MPRFDYAHLGNSTLPIYLGQGIGAAIGALVLDYTSLAALGGAGALCTLRPELNRPS